MGRAGGRVWEAPYLVGSYSQSVRVGSVVATAGQVGIDPKTGRTVGDEVASHPPGLKNLGAVLAAGGRSP
ncbi:MAG: hypothetical protein H0U55_01295 [Rubrobacteraceae bacterium]|nr:hypothetical protein [Rubrobacteraceae bacterium]